MSTRLPFLIARRKICSTGGEGNSSDAGTQRTTPTQELLTICQARQVTTGEVAADTVSVKLGEFHPARPHACEEPRTVETGT